VPVAAVKMADTMFLSSKAVGSTSGAILQEEVVQKLVLVPTNLKLEGVANYLSWSRRTRLAMEQKDLDGYCWDNQETKLVQKG
jgi:hypothetical protein